MRKINKWLALVLSTVLMSSCLAGCGSTKTNKKEKNSATEIQIGIWNSGFGVKWLENMIEAFEASQSKYTVTYTASASSAATLSAFGMEDLDTMDIYMTSLPSLNAEKFEPLTGLLESKADGEAVTIGEKFNKEYLEIERASDGNIYTLTYGGGALNFVYNTELFEKAGITQLPRTTNEFISVCDTLYGQDITPLCHFTAGGYYEYLINLYAAQYNGYDYFKNRLYANTDASGNSPSKAALLEKDGRYQALKVMEKFITPEYTMLGSNTKSHTEVQTEFLNDSAAMMLNGAWLRNEMASVGDVTKLDVMRAPVLSTIIHRMKTVETDGDLRKVITAVDKVADGEAEESAYKSGDNYVIDGLTISAEDWAIVYEARNTLASIYGGGNVFIPKYSNAKEGAMEFLKFMYSDKGYEVYVDTLRVPLPMTFSNGEMPDISEYTDFEKAQFLLLNSAVHFAEPYIESRSRLFMDGGVNIMANSTYVEVLCAQNDRDRKNADEIWQTIENLIEGNFESRWLKNIK